MLRRVFEKAKEFARKTKVISRGLKAASSALGNRGHDNLAKAADAAAKFAESQGFGKRKKRVKRAGRKKKVGKKKQAGKGRKKPINI